MLALLAARFGLDIADDAVQDALLQALGWTGEPRNPAGWIYTIARNRAIDGLRRQPAATRPGARELGRTHAAAGWRIEHQPNRRCTVVARVDAGPTHRPGEGENPARRDPPLGARPAR
ncbi:RNA polymerase sigma factor [Paeniglutamicibacter antarcticus]|uniref:RNA polymerase sigma factor n=1 Tax=Paeniglutamicibacter antarcticus TaxID=494023 RepID=UPI003CD0BC0F